MRTIIGYLLDFFYWCGDALVRQAKKIKSIYLGAGIFDKAIVFMSLGGLFAVIMSVGQYYIFETWFYINNPLAVYMIGIVFYMLVTVHVKHRWYSWVRIGVNLYYLAWVFIVHFATGLIKAPYTLNAGYFVNIAVPVIYTLLALLALFQEQGRFQR